jgi:hypothetical protein
VIYALDANIISMKSKAAMITQFLLCAAMKSMLKRKQQLSLEFLRICIKDPQAGLEWMNRTFSRLRKSRQH